MRSICLVYKEESTFCRLFYLPTKNLNALTPVNNLTSTSTSAPLSANQGRLLRGMMQCGWIEVTPSAANTPKKVHVTFPKTFASKPYVVACPMTSEVGTKVKGVSVQNFSTTGFDLWLNRSDTQATGVAWIAIQA